LATRPTHFSGKHAEEDATMTAPITLDAVAASRPGSRAARLSIPRTIDVLRQLAIEHGVCVRPQPFRYTDPETGRSTVVDLSCKSTRTSVCPACAAKAKTLRQVQCREGWHRSDEPITPEPPSEEQLALVRRRAELEFLTARAEMAGEWEAADLLRAEMLELEEQITLTGLRGLARSANAGADGCDTKKRRVRSTRRRQDVPNLPRKKVAARTIGPVYIGRDGKEHHSSTAATVTLGSYGRVRRSDSTPLDFDTYDYYRAAMDAIHFSALLDRLWQNLRRAVGWNVQYFGCVEPQKRLAPHAHYAIRGTFPRATFKQVVAGTYHNVWQPSTDTVVFGEDGPQPAWVNAGEARGGNNPAGYTSPWTGQMLPTWDQAMDALDEQIDAGLVGPVHVMRFGEQSHEDVLDDGQHDPGDGGNQDVNRDGDNGGWAAPGRIGMRGIEPGTNRAEKAIRYLTKYITKSVDECHQRTTAREMDHHHRFYEVLRFIPCSERCANWLRYGIQPDQARPGMVAGACKGRVHQPSTLGIGGRRILVSREWSGKTLADHRADQATWVRQILDVGMQYTQPDQADPAGEQLGDEFDPEVDDCESADDDWQGWTEETERDDNGEPVPSLSFGNRHPGGQSHGESARPSVAGRPLWERLSQGDRSVKPVHIRLWRSLGERIRRRTEWQLAHARLTANDTGPPGLSVVSAGAASEEGA
jgi:hypothetical protein